MFKKKEEEIVNFEKSEQLMKDFTNKWETVDRMSNDPDATDDQVDKKILESIEISKDILKIDGFADDSTKH